MKNVTSYLQRKGWIRWQIGWLCAGGATGLVSCKAHTPSSPAAATVQLPSVSSPAPLPAPLPTPDPQLFRSHPPVAAEVPPLHLPVPHRQILANGLKVLTWTQSSLPLVHIKVVLQRGSAQDPKNLPGLAHFTARMLKMGTSRRNAWAIAEALESHGALLKIETDEDAIALSATVLTPHWQAVLAVLADMVQHPVFVPAELERVRRILLGELTQNADDPRATAYRVFRRSIYGEHPYGHVPLGSPAALEKITRGQLKGYVAKHFHPGNAAVVVAGDVTSEAAVQAVQRQLGRWPAHAPVRIVSVAPPSPAAEVVLVPRADAPQSQIRVGTLGVARHDPDYFNLLIANAILGGAFNSRINLNLREDKGYTYGAYSVFEFKQSPGPFFVSTGVRTDVSVKAIEEILKEITNLYHNGVTAEEIQNAQNYYTLSLPGSFQQVETIAEMLSRLFLFDLPLDYWQKLPEQIHAVTLQQVRRAVEKHVSPEKLTIVVVGDSKQVQSGLMDLHRGPVKVCDKEGYPL